MRVKHLQRELDCCDPERVVYLRGSNGVDCDTFCISYNKHQVIIMTSNEFHEKYDNRDDVPRDYKRDEKRRDKMDFVFKHFSWVLVILLIAVIVLGVAGASKQQQVDKLTYDSWQKVFEKKNVSFEEWKALKKANLLPKYEGSK